MCNKLGYRKRHLNRKVRIDHPVPMTKRQMRNAEGLVAKFANQPIYLIRMMTANRYLAHYPERGGRYGLSRKLSVTIGSTLKVQVMIGCHRVTVREFSKEEFLRLSQKTVELYPTVKWVDDYKLDGHQGIAKVMGNECHGSGTGSSGMSLSQTHAVT